MLTAKIVPQLKRIIGEKGVLTAKEDLYAYSYDGTSVWSHMPDIVVLPNTTVQVSQILRLANENRIPVTSRGGGTNLSGGSIPIKGGIVLGTSKINKILEVNKSNLSAIVEPGVILQDFNLALAKEGLFYPPDPQSFFGCTIGGTVAENAGGPNCIKYGVTKHYVLGLEVVLASGRVINIGSRTVKNRTGYDLAMLFVGSEGTLGVITRIILKLLPMPPAHKTILAIFDDLVVAGKAVSDILAAGVIPAKLEFLDKLFMQRIEEVMPIGLPIDANALLLLQTDGSPAAVEAEAIQIFSVLKNSGAMDVRLAKDTLEEDRYWKARSVAGAAIYNSAHTILKEDVTVPRDRIAEFIQKKDAISKKHGIAIPVMGHAGDGNLHPNILTDIRDKDNFARAQEAIAELFTAALALGGVISGEHGIGLEKKPFIRQGMEPMAIEIMKMIKAILDPNTILNPGKIWEE
ncbi:FAD-binding oxidoreductase [Chloroflexota bacterium]